MNSVRFKLSLMTFILILLITGLTSLIVIEIMDSSLKNELIKRGIAIAKSSSNTAGYNIILKDRIALDNLASKTKQYQDDIAYVVIVDNEESIKAHSEIGFIGEEFIRSGNNPIRTDDDGLTVKKVMRHGIWCYEFESPISFSDKKLGTVYIGIKEKTLLIAQSNAQKNIIVASGVILFAGVIGVFLLSSFIASPIKLLMEGVKKIKKGDYTNKIQVISKDELGELTSNFNEMTKIILEQQKNLECKAEELEEAYVSTVKILATAIDARDEYTFGHSERVAKFAVNIGKKLDLPENDLKNLEIASLIHDVGKIRTPDNILYKNAVLTEEEYNQIKRHPQDGSEILQLAPSLKKHVPAVLHHHEWHNGNGYPYGLKNGEVPLFASIIGIADAYDAMISNRPYRLALHKDEAIKEILRYRGTQFNPQIANAFVEILRKDSISIEKREIRALL